MGILNLALAHLGKPPVDALNVDEPFVEWFRVNYDTVRDSVLIDNEWTFATKRMLVDDGSDEWFEPAFEYNRAYDLVTPDLRFAVEARGQFLPAEFMATGVEKAPYPSINRVRASFPRASFAASPNIKKAFENAEGSKQFPAASFGASLGVEYKFSIFSQKTFPAPGFLGSLKTTDIGVRGEMDFPAPSFQVLPQAIDDSTPNRRITFDGVYALNLNLGLLDAVDEHGSTYIYEFAFVFEAKTGTVQKNWRDIFGLSSGFPLLQGTRTVRARLFLQGWKMTSPPMPSGYSASTGIGRANNGDYLVAVWPSARILRYNVDAGWSDEVTTLPTGETSLSGVQQLANGDILSMGPAGRKVYRYNVDDGWTDELAFTPPDGEFLFLDFLLEDGGDYIFLGFSVGRLWRYNSEDGFSEETTVETLSGRLGYFTKTANGDYLFTVGGGIGRYNSTNGWTSEISRDESPSDFSPTSAITLDSDGNVVALNVSGGTSDRGIWTYGNFISEPESVITRVERHLDGRRIRVSDSPDPDHLSDLIDDRFTLIAMGEDMVVHEGTLMRARGDTAVYDFDADLPPFNSNELVLIALRRAMLNAPQAVITFPAATFTAEVTKIRETWPIRADITLPVATFAASPDIFFGLSVSSLPTGITYVMRAIITTGRASGDGSIYNHTGEREVGTLDDGALVIGEQNVLQISYRDDTGFIILSLEGSVASGVIESGDSLYVVTANADNTFTTVRAGGIINSGTVLYFQASSIQGQSLNALANGQQVLFGIG